MIYDPDELCDTSDERPYMTEEEREFDDWLDGVIADYKKKYPNGNPNYNERFCARVEDAKGCEMFPFYYTQCHGCIYTEGYDPEDFSCAIYGEKPDNVAEDKYSPSKPCKYRRLSGDPTIALEH